MLKSSYKKAVRVFRVICYNGIIWAEWKLVGATPAKVCNSKANNICCRKTLGHNFGDPGVPRDTPQDTGVQTWIFADLGWVWGSTWDPLWSHGGDFFVIWVPKLRKKCPKWVCRKRLNKKNVMRSLPRWPNVAPIQ